LSSDIYLDHIAVAVSSLADAIKVYEDIGLEFSPEREEVKEQGVRTAFASIDTNAHLELLEPTNDLSPIKKYIDKKGEGIHHMCFRVTDVVKKHSELSAKGYKFIYDTPKTGAGGMLVNFIHPKSTGGVLIELSQKVEK
jgi:methylmalonyl-CoA/ethylmalonyl-CoA epimerase